MEAWPTDGRATVTDRQGCTVQAVFSADTVVRGTITDSLGTYRFSMQSTAFSVSKTAFGKAESRLLQNHPYFTITVTLVKLYLVAFRLKPEGPSHLIM